MSDTFFDPNAQGYTEDQLKEFNAGTLRPLTIPLGKAAAAATSLIKPDTNLPGFWANVPGVGVGEQALGIVDALTRLPAAGQDYLADKLNLPSLKSQPTPEVVKTAETNLAKTREDLYKETGAPQIDPNNPVEQILGAAGEGAGSFFPIGGAAQLIAKLPKAAQMAAHFALPSTTGAGANAVLGTVLGTTGETLGQVADKLEPPPQQVAPPQQDAAVTPPPVETRSVFDGEPPTQSVFGSPQLPAPTYSAEGESPTDWAHGAATFLTLLTGVIAGKYAHSLGARLTTAELDARMSHPEYVQAAQDFNDAQLRAKGTVSPSEVDAPVVPASPNPVANAMDRVTTGVKQAFDQTATARAYIEATSDNPVASDALSRTVGDAYNQQKQEAATREFLRTGVSPNGYKSEVPLDLYKKRAALNDDQVKLFNEGIGSANEIDNRLNSKRKAGLNPMTSTPQDMRLQFKDVDDPDLLANVARVQTDPQVADVFASYKRLAADLPKMLNYEGALPTVDMNRLLAERPNYVPTTDIYGKVSGGISPRESTGAQYIYDDPVKAMAQHVEQLHAMIAQNNFRRGYLEHQDSVQNRYPDSAQWSERVSEANDKEPIVSYATQSGWQYRRVSDPVHRAILTKDSPTQAKIHLGAANTMRKMYQRTVTGPMAMIGGKFFAPINPLYTSMQATVNMPKEGYRGPIDMALRKMTGDRVGTGPFAMADAPLNLAASLGYAAPRTMIDHATNSLSRMFDPKNKAQYGATRILSNAIGDTQMQAISDSMKNYYLGTQTHLDRLAGHGGAGVAMRADIPSKAVGHGMRDVQMIANELVPELFVGGGIRPKAIWLRRAVDQVFNDIGDSGHSWLNRLNANNPNLTPEERINMVRNVSGDVGKTPGSKLVRGVSQLLPFSNVSMQGISASIKPFVDHPIGSSLKLITGLGMLNALSMYTAMQDPKTLDDYENHLSSSERASRMVFYVGGQKIMLPMPQEWQWLHPLVGDLMSKAFNITAAMHDADVHGGVTDWLEQLLHSHIMNSSLVSSRQGGNNALNFLNVPQEANVVASLFGKRLDMNYERMYERAQTPGLFWSPDTIIQGAGSDKPGSNEVNGPLEGNNAKILQNIMESLYGITGHVMENVTGLIRHYQESPGGIDGFWEALGKTGHDWLQRAKDMNPMGNTILFENEMRLSSNPPNVEQVENTLAAMKQLQGAKTAEKYEGLTGPKGLPVAPDATSGTKVPDAQTQPEMNKMFYTAAAEYQFIESRLKPEINAINTQMHSYEDKGDPAAIRSWINDQKRLVADKYAGIQDRINVLNMQLSQIAGKQVDVRRIDWQKGLEQFH